MQANKSLVLTAQAAFNCCGCLIEAGFANQVGVKSSCVRWQRGVSCSASLLIVAFGVPQHNSGVSLAKTGISFKVFCPKLRIFLAIYMYCHKAIFML